MESIFSKAQSRLENKYTNMSNMMGNRISQAANMPGAPGSPYSNIASALGTIIVGGVNLGAFIKYPPLASSATQQEILAACTQVASQAKSILAQLIENAKEADLDKLKAQQDAQLEPIAEKEADLNAEVATNEALTTIWEQRRDAAKEKRGQAIEYSIGKYGIK